MSRVFGTHLTMRQPHLRTSTRTSRRAGRAAVANLMSLSSFRMTTSSATVPRELPSLHTSLPPVGRRRTRSRVASPARNTDLRLRGSCSGSTTASRHSRDVGSHVWRRSAQDPTHSTLLRRTEPPRRHGPASLGPPSPLTFGEERSGRWEGKELVRVWAWAVLLRLGRI